MGFQQFRPRIGTRTDAEFDDAPDVDASLAAGSAAVAATPSKFSADSAKRAFQQLPRVAERLHHLAPGSCASKHAPGTGRALWPDAFVARSALPAHLAGRLRPGSPRHSRPPEQHGISVNIVFQIELLQQRCERIGLLLDVVLARNPNARCAVPWSSWCALGKAPQPDRSVPPALLAAGPQGGPSAALKRASTTSPATAPSTSTCSSEQRAGAPFWSAPPS